MKRKIRRFTFIGLIFLMVCCFTGIAVGTASLSIMEIFNIIMSKLPFIGEHIPKTWQDNIEDIVLKVRIPRAILGLIVGASLSVAGVILQSLLKNPLADPYLLGISSGAALGSTLAILLYLPFYVIGIPVIPAFSFLGATSSMFLVYGLARTKGKIPVHTLLLSGVIINFSFSAIMMLLIALSNKGLNEIIFWMMGSLNNANYNLIPFIFISSLGIIIILYLFSNDLNVISLGEETAIYLGIETEKVKKIMFVLTSLLTGLAVSVSGLIGFIGLIIPHISRLIVGPDHRVLVPFSAALGGGFLILADVTCRIIIPSTEIPIGVITAILGGPFFLYLLKRRK